MRSEFAGPAVAALLVSIGLASPASASGSLELIPRIPLLLPLIALFALLIFPVNGLIFKPIFSALDERERRIAGARKRAEQIDTEAGKVLQRYETSIREARAQAEATRKAQITEARAEQASIARSARSEAERRLERASEELASALGDARAALRQQTAELARASAERVLGRSLQ